MNRRNMLSHSCLTTDPPPTPRSPVTSAFSSTVQSLKRKNWEYKDLIFFQVTIDNLLEPLFSDGEDVLWHQCKGSETAFLFWTINRRFVDPELSSSFSSATHIKVRMEGCCRSTSFHNPFPASIGDSCISVCVPCLSQNVLDVC